MQSPWLSLMRGLLAWWVGSLWMAWPVQADPASAPDTSVRVPILVYHRFGPEVADSMTVRTRTVEAQLDLLARTGHPVIPLQWLIDYLQGHRPGLPAGAVVITVDDGHASVFTELAPLVQRRHIPVTLFIYPSAISNASYAMTWAQLQTLQATGLFDVQSHTYWHPNFARERRQRTPDDYRAFVQHQLQLSRTVLEKRMGHPVTQLAWPFGLYDEVTVEEARAAGYTAALTLRAQPATRHDTLLELPRFLMVEPPNSQWFQRIINTATPTPAAVP